MIGEAAVADRSWGKSKEEVLAKGYLGWIGGGSLMLQVSPTCPVTFTVCLSLWISTDVCLQYNARTHKLSIQFWYYCTAFFVDPANPTVVEESPNCCLSERTLPVMQRGLLFPSNPAPPEPSLRGGKRKREPLDPDAIIFEEGCSEFDCNLDGIFWQLPLQPRQKKQHSLADFREIL